MLTNWDRALLDFSVESEASTGRDNKARVKQTDEMFPKY